MLTMSDVCSLSARTDAELGQDVADMSTGRGAADEERLSNLRVRAAGDEETQHFLLTHGQSRPGCMSTTAGLDGSGRRGKHAGCLSHGVLERQRPPRILGGDEAEITQRRPCGSLGTLVDRP